MKRDDIIRAAFTVWGKDLYRTTSLSDVARALGVTKPALYRHFKNKDALMEALYEDFFDRYAAYLRLSVLPEDFFALDKTEKIVRIVRTIGEYYLRQRGDFVFSCTMVLGNPKEKHGMASEMRRRGFRMEEIVSGDRRAYASFFNHLAVMTAFFFVAQFHGSRTSEELAPSAEELSRALDTIEVLVRRGFGFNKERIDRIPYGELEKEGAQAASSAGETSELMKAVAQVVALAGPWNATMELVAQRSGLSKSGLYAHFSGKREMLRELFVSEFERISEMIAAQGRMAQGPEDRLYRALVVTAEYLRTHPDILVALDWVRIKRFDLGLLIPTKILSVFEFSHDVSMSLDMNPLTMAQWVMFLVVNFLMHGSKIEPGDPEYPLGLRRLYRYITLGLEGWQ